MDAHALFADIETRVLALTPVVAGRLREPHLRVLQARAGEVTHL